MNEGLWRKAEANQVIRERRRLFKNGTTKPTSHPNILVRTPDARGWKFPAVSTR